MLTPRCLCLQSLYPLPLRSVLPQKAVFFFPDKQYQWEDWMHWDVLSKEHYLIMLHLNMKSVVKISKYNCHYQQVYPFLTCRFGTGHACRVEAVVWLVVVGLVILMMAVFTERLVGVRCFPCIVSSNSYSFDKEWVLFSSLFIQMWNLAKRPTLPKVIPQGSGNTGFEARLTWILLKEKRLLVS